MNSIPERSSARMQAVQSPIIPEVAAKIRNTPGTISLGQGIVYYGPPPQAVERMNAALLETEVHQYGPVAGIPELHEAIGLKLARDNLIDLEGYALVTTAGSNLGFYNAVLAISDPGDEFIIADPYYFNHEMAIRMAGCKPVSVAVDQDFQLQPDAVFAAVTDRTKAIVTISPNNPTGAVYPEPALRRINQFCGANRIYHISDEAYENFVYDGGMHFSPGSIAGASGYTISLFSFSKAYGFAGWRIGYMLVPTFLAGTISKIQDTVLICPPLVTQYAALGALTAGPDYIRSKKQHIESMRKMFLRQLEGLADLVDPPVAEGAFYILLKIHTDLGDLSVVDYLIQQQRVAVIPGSAFGIDQGCYLRIAYAALDRKTAELGAGRLVTGLRELIRSA